MKNTLFIFLAFTTLLATAQLPQTNKIVVTWGEAFSAKKTTYSEVLHTDGNKIYISKIVKNNTVIEEVDGNLKSLRTLEFSKEKSGIRMDLEGLFYFHNKFVILCSDLDNKSKTNTLYFSTLDIETGIQGNWEELVKIDFEQKRRAGNFSYDISPDSNTLILYYNLPFVDSDAPEKFGLRVLDKNFKEMWQKEIQLAYNESLFGVRNFEVDNNGNAYILGQEFAAKEDRVKGLPNYKYHILAYRNKGVDYKDFEIELDDKFIKDITFGFSGSNNDLACAGFYSENGRSSIKGTFYVLIDGQSQKTLKSTFKSFEESFITEGWSDRAIAKAKKKEDKKGTAIEAYEYDLRDFIVYEDGSISMLAEQYYVRVVTTTTTDANGVTRTTTTYHYYYNDIIIVNISNNGTINWASKIDKYQHSTNDGGYLSSYALLVANGNLHMIYNLNARYLYEKDDYKELDKKDKKAYLTLFVTVDSKGVVTKEILIDNKQQETTIVPKMCEEFGEDKMFIFTQWGAKKKKLGTLFLK